MPRDGCVDRRFGLGTIKRHGAADHRKHVVELSHHGKASPGIQSTHADFSLQSRKASTHVLATNLAAQQSVSARHQKTDFVLSRLRIDRSLSLINGRRPNQQSPLPRYDGKRSAPAAAARQIKRVARRHERLVDHDIGAAHDFHQIAAGHVHHTANIIGPDTGAIEDRAGAHLALAACFGIL